MKRYRVRIIEDAEHDLVDIYQYVALNDSPDKAAYVLEQLELICLSLVEIPSRGHIPPELNRASVTAYREVHFKPYRIIYEAIGQEVFIHRVLDGHRDIVSLLERRLLR